MGAAVQPETSPTDAIHTANPEGKGYLSRVPTQNPYVQTIGAELKSSSDKPGAVEHQPGNPNANTPEGVAHAEPGSTPREETNPDTNAPMQPEDMGPDVLLAEDGITRENAGIDGDKDPHVELQEPGWPPHHTGGQRAPDLVTTHHPGGC